MTLYNWTGICIGLIWTTVISLKASEVPEEVLLIARCRVNCMETILHEDSSLERESCHTCWQTCGFLYQEYDVWNRFCLLKEICNYGCRTACNFHQGVPSASHRKRKEHFREPPKAKLASSSLVDISWVFSDEEKHKRIVYVLLKRDVHTQDWISIFQTPSLSASFKAVNISEDSIFLLLAVDSKGILADEKFVIHLRTKNDDQQMQEKANSNRKNSLISYQNFTEIDNALVAMLHLKYAPKLKTGEIIHKNFLVNWFLEECGIFLDTPECDFPPQHYGPITAKIFGNTVVVTLTNLLYNSVYTVRLETSENQAKNFELQTPKCYAPNTFFTHCNRIEIFSKSKEPETFDIYTESLIYDKNLNKAVGNFSWNSFIEHENIRYIVSWQAPGDLKPIDILLAGKAETFYPNITLSLEPSLIYKIEVQAIYGEWDNITLRSAHLYVNTSFQVDDEESTMTDVKKHIFPDVNQILNILAVVVFAVLVVTSISLVIICNRKTKWKNIVIAKNIVSKSNSYKSNVSGYKMDYSSDANVVDDEWELDPSMLEFSTPLGQGAFGKVVCGFYCKRKVAIKVVRDSAPLSYKEDLLAELRLMKKIGRHPNIVTMIGACTKKEPIAIVMEFVPNGNLLSFLIKCRHETEDGYAEMDVNVDDKENLTPVKMLSFARQISMAMQYLSENKYVHRDLAARNVLLDQNKVAKICDFGLSRDIYKENIYQKLTNGKLPIKWMAIESLRDRIFTTYSDVWSFGILLWEIVTMGASPYPGIPLSDLYHVLSTGYRMEKPNNCSEELYDIMRLTWAEKPKDRPEFHQLKTKIEDLLSKNSNYLDLALQDQSSEFPTDNANPDSD